MSAKYFLQIKGEDVLKLKTIEVCLGITLYDKGIQFWVKKMPEVELRLLQKLSFQSIIFEF